MDVQALICVFLSRMNGEGGFVAICSAFAVPPAVVQATDGPVYRMSGRPVTGSRSNLPYSTTYRASICFCINMSWCWGEGYPELDMAGEGRSEHV